MNVNAKLNVSWKFKSTTNAYTKNINYDFIKSTFELANKSSREILSVTR